MARARTPSGRNPTTGGQHAIAGILFQILRSVQLGLRVTADIVLSPDQLPSMTLTLEPVDAGDLRLDRAELTTIEQVKIRAPHRRWTSATIAREVLPNLLNGSRPGTPQLLRFVTNNSNGLEPLRDFLARRPEKAISRRTGKLCFGRKLVTTEEFAACLAAEADIAADDPRFIWLLDNLSIGVVDTTDAEVEIDGLLTPMLSPGVRVADKRHELISRLMEAGREGRTIEAGELLAMISPDALRRLQHARTLPGHLSRTLTADCVALGYISAQQVRPTAFAPSAWVTVLSGESGQGKTWSLCQAALAQVERGEHAVVFRAPSDFDAFINAINERIWLPAYEQVAPLLVIARRLAPDLPSHDGCWLTVYLDDLQDRALAEALARIDWPGLGIRLVISAQPRITDAIRRARADTAAVPIGNFTSAELRRYLRCHGGEAPLETMPDDVFELLLKPIHARVFVELPARSEWVGATEYELFKAYWDFGTGQARNQYDHPRDGERLAALAGTLLGSRPRYPWRLRDLEQAGLDEHALRRLEAVGLIRRPEPGRLMFASDRMLNWAVAEYLVARITDEGWLAAQADQELDRIESIVAPDGTPIGRRLGYVFLDALWLLLREATPTFVADLLLACVLRQPHEWRGEEMWSRHLGTLGSGLLPALEILAARPYDEDRDWDIPRNIPSALVSAAETDRDAAAATIRRLLASGTDQAVMVALKAARHIAMREDLDTLWSIHIERERQLAHCTSQLDERGRLLRRRDLSSAALKPAVAAAPSWLDRRIGATVDPIELNQLLWQVIDSKYVDETQAREMWVRHQTHIIATLPDDSTALIAALGHFGDISNRARLDAVPRTREDWLASRVLRSRARTDPAAAFQQIRDRDEEHAWSASTWWLPELARVDARQLSSAIRENASRGDHPLIDVVLFYSHYPELMDEESLEWTLDTFAGELEALNNAHNAIPDANLGRLSHVLRFLPKLTEAWQFDCLARRAGTALEHELVRFASRRQGRTSRQRDTEGVECERILAMIGGEGYDALVAAELERADRFGREDGYAAAHWSESLQVRAALRTTNSDHDTDGYREVMLMQALAVHQCDVELEAMIRANTPVYFNAAEMRRAAGRQTFTLRTRVEALIETGDPEDLRVAAKLAGFLRDASEAKALVPKFLDPSTPEATRQAMIGTFKVLSLYEPTLLPAASALLMGRIDNEAQFVAAYLAENGDEEARQVVVEWLGTLELGTWSPSRNRFLGPLLDHHDSRPAVVAFLQRSRERGHVLREGVYLRVLADAGDTRAQEELGRAAYRKPDSFLNDTVAGILYLRTTDPEEAFFAAARLLARHRQPAAIDLLLQIDIESALPLLLRHYRTARPSIRWEIARRLRIYVKEARLSALLETLVRSNHSGDRRIAIELGGWMPTGFGLEWLEAFADDRSPTIRETAQAALRKRARERAAMGHLHAMQRSSKPLKWARLSTIFECIDPYFLWSRNDPASLEKFFEANSTEFLIEAQKFLSQRRAALEDKARRADRDAD